jgi:DNA recombination protein RmuC
MEMLLLAGLAGVLLGAAAAWLWRGARIAALATENEGLRASTTELSAVRNRMFEMGRESERLRADLDNAKTAHEAQIAQFAQLRKEMTDQFQLLAGEALKANSADFSKRAEELFRSQKELTAAEIDKRSREMSDLVKPLGETLKAYEAELKKVEQARIENYGGLKEAMEAARAQHDEVKMVTANLVTALKASPKTRGRWGEETLRRVMELSGMVEHCDFETEKHFRDYDESLRPDVLINVSGGRTVVVDAKAPVTAFLESIAAADEAERDLLLARHAKQLRERLTNLSSKAYWEKIGGSTDCVVMFVPGDNFVSAAFERDPDLFEDGVKNRVLICSPTTFIALAKAISYGWRQEKLAENYEEIKAIGRELYLRLRTMSGHISQMGGSLESAVRHFNNFIGSLEDRVLPQARRFNDLGIDGTSKEMDILEQIDRQPRALQQKRDLRAVSGGGPAES